LKEEEEKLRNQNNLNQSSVPTKLIEGNSFISIKEVSDENLPKVNLVKSYAAPDIAVQKNIDYIRNLEKIKAERARLEKEYQEKKAAEESKNKKSSSLTNILVEK